MTLNEFKAWFEGFSETMDGPPSEKQWDRIKARVAEINGAVTPYPVFIDRYVSPYRRWFDVPVWNGSPQLSVGNTADASGFDRLPAMKAAGLAEYRAALPSA